LDRNDEIAKVAYELFERDGREHGRDQEHWHEAEEIVRARHARQSGKAPAKKTRAAQPEKPIVKKSPKGTQTGASSKARAKPVAGQPKKSTRPPRAK
jgi:hypothetical protein